MFIIIVSSVAANSVDLSLCVWDAMNTTKIHHNGTPSVIWFTRAGIWHPCVLALAQLCHSWLLQKATVKGATHLNTSRCGSVMMQPIKTNLFCVLLWLNFLSNFLNIMGSWHCKGITRYIRNITNCTLPPWGSVYGVLNRHVVTGNYELFWTKITQMNVKHIKEKIP